VKFRILGPQCNLIDHSINDRYINIYIYFFNQTSSRYNSFIVKIEILNLLENIIEGILNVLSSSRKNLRGKKEVKRSPKKIDYPE